MKRIGNIYHKVISIENLTLADAIASRGKARQRGVIHHNKNRDANISALHATLVNNAYRTSAYTTFKVYEPKERTVFRLPYYPDRIMHHAIMNILEPVFVATFTADTYSCIKGKGIHAACRAVRKAMCDEANTQYYLKLDIKKYYPSINHDVLKQLLRRKIKDAQLLQLLDEIIDSAEGLPIGNYLSQYFANFYLTYFDHWLKEVKQVQYYFRYADDMVIFSSNKQYLHGIFADIKQYLNSILKLQVKNNWRIAPIRTGLDFLGYVFYPTHTRLRKTIKQRFARMLKRRPRTASIGAYWGWAKHCNSNHLIKKLLTTCSTLKTSTLPRTLRRSLATKSRLKGLSTNQL